MCRENAIGSANRVYRFDSAGEIVYSEVVPYRVEGATVSAENSGYAAYLTIPSGVLAVAVDCENILYPSDVNVIGTVDTGSGPYMCIHGKALKLGAGDK